MCRLQFYRNIQKKSTNPSIRTLVSTLQCRFLCVFRILPYTHSANQRLFCLQVVNLHFFQLVLLGAVLSGLSLPPLKLLPAALFSVPHHKEHGQPCHQGCQQQRGKKSTERCLPQCSCYLPPFCLLYAVMRSLAVSKSSLSFSASRFTSAT